MLAVWGNRVIAIRAAVLLIVSETAIEFVRLPYDVETTVRKVEMIPELDNFLGTRLREGR